MALFRLTLGQAGLEFLCDLELRTLPSTGITGVATVPRSFVPMIQPRASSMVSVYQLIYISSPGQVHVNMEIWDVELGPTHTSR